jgi:vacuolar-type H+-ATPase subunit I/STV1
VSDNLIKDYNEFIKEEEKLIKASSQVVEDDYKNFIDKEEDRLNELFNKENRFQTSVRGIKVRGSFPTQEEAEKNCKKLRQNDPSHDIYVAPCGVWLPWEPTYYKLDKVDYLEPELNRLHEEKIKNEILAKNEFDKRIKDAKRKAIEENIEAARKSGNKLTQTLDVDGNLVGVNTMNFDDREVSSTSGREEHEANIIAKLNG